jgi:hypothetical protein
VALTGPGPQVALGPKRTFFCFFCCFSAGRPLQTAKNKNVKRVKNKTLKRRNDHICGLKKGEHSEPFARRRHKLRIRTRLRRTDPRVRFFSVFLSYFYFFRARLGARATQGPGPLRAQIKAYHIYYWYDALMIRTTMDQLLLTSSLNEQHIHLILIIKLLLVAKM